MMYVEIPAMRRNLPISEHDDRLKVHVETRRLHIREQQFRVPADSDHEVAHACAARGGEGEHGQERQETAHGGILRRATSSRASG